MSAVVQQASSHNGNRRTNYDKKIGGSGQKTGAKEAKDGARSVRRDDKEGASASQKMKFCMYHLQGVCKYANSSCPFAHSTEEMQGARGKGSKKKGAAQAPSPANHAGGYPMAPPMEGAAAAHAAAAAAAQNPSAWMAAQAEYEATFAASQRYTSAFPGQHPGSAGWDAFTGLTPDADPRFPAAWYKDMVLQGHEQAQAYSQAQAAQARASAFAAAMAANAGAVNPGKGPGPAAADDYERARAAEQRALAAALGVNVGGGRGKKNRPATPATPASSAAQLPASPSVSTPPMYCKSSTPPQGSPTWPSEEPMFVKPSRGRTSNSHSSEEGAFNTGDTFSRHASCFEECEPGNAGAACILPQPYDTAYAGAFVPASNGEATTAALSQLPGLPDKLGQLSSFPGVDAQTGRALNDQDLKELNMTIVRLSEVLGRLTGATNSGEHGAIDQEALLAAALQGAGPLNLGFGTDGGSPGFDPRTEFAANSWSSLPSMSMPPMPGSQAVEYYEPAGKGFQVTAEMLEQQLLGNVYAGCTKGAPAPPGLTRAVGG